MDYWAHVPSMRCDQGSQLPKPCGGSYCCALVWASTCIRRLLKLVEATEDRKSASTPYMDGGREGVPVAMPCMGGKIMRDFLEAASHKGEKGESVSATTVYMGGKNERFPQTGS